MSKSNINDKSGSQQDISAVNESAKNIDNPIDEEPVDEV